MKSVAIIGANGQVGSEVCLLLEAMEGVRPVAICRSEIGSAFLRRCGVEVRHAASTDAGAMRAALSGCDIVADFSLPTGSASEVRSAMGAMIPAIVSSAPAGVPHVYASSITAFGVPDFHHELKMYRFSRNMYGACKRFGERMAASAARATGRDSYVLRVGVVHGELQAVTRKTMQTVRSAGERAVFVPDVESYSVFAFSIAETLAAIANGREKPGLYTMLSNPGWSWRDLHLWYCQRAGVAPRVELLPKDASPSRWGRLLRAVAKPVFAGKDIIASYLTASSPAMENQLRAVYHRRNAARQVAEGERASQYRPYGNNHSVFPGKRPQSISDSRVTMEPYARKVREVLRQCLDCELAGRF